MENISASVKEFILSHFPPARLRSIGESDSLIESGIIDSMGVLDVVTFLESRFNLTVDDEDLVPENFQSIGQMAAFVAKKRNG